MYKARRPRFKRGNEFVAVVDIARYGVKAGEAFKPMRDYAEGPQVAHSIIRMYYNRKKVGYKGHVWTAQAIAAYKKGERIRPFSVHETRDEAGAARVKYQIIRDTGPAAEVETTPLVADGNEPVQSQVPEQAKANSPETRGDDALASRLVDDENEPPAPANKKRAANGKFAKKGDKK